MEESFSIELNSQDFEAVKNYIITGDLTDVVKQCIREEKYLNDVYRFYKVGDKDIDDDFDFNNLVPVG